MKKQNRHILFITCFIIFLLSFTACSGAQKYESDRETVDETTANIDDLCIDVLASNDIICKSTRSKGITWQWNPDQTLAVNGTAKDRSFTNLYHNKKKLPRGVKPGDTLYSRLSIQGGKVQMEFLFYLADGQIEAKSISNSGAIKVPENAVGLSLRPIVEKDETADALIQCFELYRPIQKNAVMPMIVSFVDDDATKEDYVLKYHDACVKNGIIGTYAVITGNLERGRTRPETLQAYQEEGFAMLPHCYHQDALKYPYWRGDGSYRPEEELEQCRQDLTTCISGFETYGLKNPFLWITPFGIHDEDIVNLGEELGMKALFSVATDGINSVYHDDRWNIERFSLGTDERSLEDAKATVDEFVNLGQGWLIITTHFNSWGDVSWNETPDENGNETGYEQFNDIVQYVRDAGLTVMTMPEAFELYEPFLDSNFADYENAVALK